MLMQHQDNTIKSLYEIREEYIEEKKREQKKLLKHNLSNLIDQLDTYIAKAEDIKDFKVIAQKMDLSSMDELKEIGETLRIKLKNGIGLIAAVIEGKLNLVCSVSDNLIKDKNLNAGKLISEVAKELGGGGGGRPQIATAGAKDVGNLEDAMKNFVSRLKN